MKIIRRRVRSAFLWGAISFIGVVVVGVTHPDLAATHGSAAYYMVMSVSALLAGLYGAAWYTTQKPSPYRNNWAVAASSLSLIWGVIMAYAMFRLFPSSPRAEIPAVITILVGGAGLYLYAPGGSPAKPESATKAAASAKSEEFAPAPQATVERRAFAAPTAIASSLATVSASSPELATAAAGPAGPSAPWDPLQFIRVPETLDKMRG
jgi:hypothetical protein